MKETLIAAVAGTLAVTVVAARWLVMGSTSHPNVRYGRSSITHWTMPLAKGGSNPIWDTR